MLEKNKEKKSLSSFKVILPNGEQVLLFTTGGPLICETGEEKREKFLNGLEMRLGHYSYLKKEVMMILSSLKYMTKLHEQIIKICIKNMVSHKLKIEGKTRKERHKIRNDLFEIINLHGYIIEKYPIIWIFENLL